MDPVKQFFTLKITASAKLVALHFAGILDPDAKDTPLHPKVGAEAVGLSRGEYERAWRECVRRKWMVGHSPTKLTMPAGVLPRLVVEALAQMSRRGHAPVAVPSAPEPPSRPKEQHEGSRNHGQASAGNVRRGFAQGAR